MVLEMKNQPPSDLGYKVDIDSTRVEKGFVEG
jgi:hypothetical protein